MSDQGLHALHALHALHGREVYVTGHGQALSRIHDKSRCAGKPCVIHAPIQGQPWSGWPTLWRDDWGGFMERLCPCGVGHPAAEDVLRRDGDGFGVHGCCGCPCWMDVEEKEKDMEPVREAGEEFPDSVRIQEKLDRLDVWAQGRENKDRRIKEDILAQRQPVQEDTVALDRAALEADMQAKIQALRDELKPLALLAKQRYEAGIPVDSSASGFLAAAIHQVVGCADVRAISGVLIDLFWKLDDRG